MKFVTSKIIFAAQPPVNEMVKFNNPVTNPFFHLESPEVQKMGTNHPVETKNVGEGVNKALFHTYENSPKTVVKRSGDINDLHEALAYHIGEQIAPGLVPPTGIRNHLLHDTWQPHSVQKYVEGGVAHPHNKIVPHPDNARMHVFDYLINNHDRHLGNVLYNPDTDRVHAIDNGLAFHHRPYTGRNPYGYPSTAEIPVDIRENVLAANTEKLKDLFDRSGMHPDKWEGFQKRLQTMQGWLANPAIKNGTDLENAINPKQPLIQRRMDRMNLNPVNPVKPKKPPFQA